MSKFADHSAERGLGASLRTWGMILLTLIFVLLYGAALLGWVKSLTDDKLIGRLEPIVFVILGYYFGRLPADQNESLLRDEINRQMRRVDAAQHARDQAEQARGALEEKMKNVRVVLAPAATGAASVRQPENAERAAGPVRDDALRQSVAKALDILKA